MTKRRKTLIGVGVVAFLALLGFLSLREERGKVVEVRAEEVRPRDLVARVSATGHIEPKKKVELRAEVSGRIVELPVQEGQDVEEGDLLMIIDRTQYEAAVDQTKASLAQAEAQEAQARSRYKQAARDAQRLRTLQERTPDLVTAQEVELAVTEADAQAAVLRAAEHAVSQARARVDEAKDRLEKTVIRSPMSGRVTRLDMEVGETVILASFMDPLLMTISDLSVIEAVMEVDETDIPDIRMGDSAVVEIDAFPDREFSGRVTKIGNSSIRPPSQSGTAEGAIDFEVRVTLDDPPERVRPDLSTTADVITAVRQKVLAIPITALTLLPAEEVERIPSEILPDTGRLASRRDVEGVFVVEEGIARFRPVEVGIAGESYFEVLDGLREGARVVSGSYQAIRDLKDGDRVKVTEVDTVRWGPGTASPADDGTS
ncbi:MAG: efflux RND transporter periplasmic adaptor subunit [Gemmatimonadota bacterium]